MSENRDVWVKDHTHTGHFTESQRAMIAARMATMKPGGDRSGKASILEIDPR